MTGFEKSNEEIFIIHWLVWCYFIGVVNLAQTCSCSSKHPLVGAVENDSLFIVRSINTVSDTNIPPTADHVQQNSCYSDGTKCGLISLGASFPSLFYWRGSPEIRLWHDDVIKWKHFPRYWPFVRGIHRWLVNSPYKGQWRGALMFLWFASE